MRELFKKRAKIFPKRKLCRELCVKLHRLIHHQTFYVKM